MKDPIEVIEKLRDNVYSEEWVEKLYGEKEFTFTIIRGGSISNPKREENYTKTLQELSEHEIKFLIGNWLNKYDNRPRVSDGNQNR